MCSYLRGILATQAVLEGVGVGEGTNGGASFRSRPHPDVAPESATPLAAAVQWVVRDGAGMLGGLAFSTWGGSRFDANARRWRLFADVINDVGLLLDMVSPLVPSCFLATVCVASVCKVCAARWHLAFTVALTLEQSFCGVAAGATRAAITSHFALQDNLAGEAVDASFSPLAPVAHPARVGGGWVPCADVAAKEGAQETFVTLCGLLSGMALAQWLNSSPATVWAAFLLLTALHVVANYRAVKALTFRTLNVSRLLVALRLWEVAQSSVAPPEVRRAAAASASPRGVARLEPILMLPWRTHSPEVALGRDPRRWPGGPAAVDRAAETLRSRSAACVCVCDLDDAVAYGKAGQPPAYPATPAQLAVWAAPCPPRPTAAGRAVARSSILLAQRPDADVRGEAQPGPGRAQLEAVCEGLLRYSAAVRGGAPPVSPQDRARELLVWLEGRGWETGRVQVPDEGWRLRTAARPKEE